MTAKKSNKTGTAYRTMDPAVTRWLREIGGEIKRRREAKHEKQEAFADRLGISRATMSVVERGTRGYGVDVMLKALSGVVENPAEFLLDRQLPPMVEAHLELHRKLQELLDAEEKWSQAAQINVDAVYGLFQAMGKKK